MTKDTESGPVRRKIRAAGAELAGGVDERAVRVWQQAGARALKAAVGMNARVTAVDSSLVGPDDLPELFEDGELVALMENDEGCFGLALVSPGLLVSVVEMQTIGRVTDRPFRPRRPTAVDGALVGPAIDRLMAGADAALSAVGLRDPATEYRYATLSEPDTPPTLSLADAPHRLLTLDLRIDSGLRTGSMRFLTPQLPPPRAERAEGGDWEQKIEEVVMASDIALDARLGRVQMPVEQVLALRAGDTVPFSREDLQRVRLVAGAGHEVAQARLGQSDGFRAVKLNVDLSPARQLDGSPPADVKEEAEPADPA